MFLFQSGTYDRSDLPAVLMLEQLLIALAGKPLQCVTIDDCDVTARIGDGAQLLDLAGNFRDRRAAHTEHLGQKFLRELHRIAFRAIGRLQQPATESGLNGVQRVASRGDAGLQQQDLVVVEAEIPDGIAVIDDLAELGRGYPCHT